MKKKQIKKIYLIHDDITVTSFLVGVSRNEGKMGSHKSGVHRLDEVTESKWCMSVICGSTNCGGHPMTMLLAITDKNHKGIGVWMNSTEETARAKRCRL